LITSPHNDKLKEVRRLHRRREGRFVAEGEDLLDAAAHAGWPAVYELRSGIDVEPELLDQVSGLGSGTRALGVYEQRWSAPTGPLCVALWGVHDPGNVGTILRSAAAFGASCVAIGPDTADPFGPKAVRASMGAIFAMPVARVASVAQLPAPRVARPTSRRMSFIGSTLRTRGTTSKLFSGGGDWVNHSSVFPCHGSLPARFPRFMLSSTFTTVTSTPIPRMNEPIVEIRLYSARLPTFW